jgi:hypothetical protein
MKTNSCLSYGVTTLDGIFEWRGSRLVHRSHERPRSDNNGSRHGIVRPDVTREDGLVPAGPRPDEIDDRDLELVCSAKSAVVRLIDVA